MTIYPGEFCGRCLEISVVSRDDKENAVDDLSLTASRENFRVVRIFSGMGRWAWVRIDV